MILLYIFLFYVLSGFIFWYIMHKYEDDPKIWMVIIIFVPIANFIVCLLAIIGIVIELASKIDLNKFFKK